MASQVYPVAELMTQVLGFASLHTIISVGHANMQGRDYMRATLASFVKDMLEPYLPEPADRETFMRALETSGGVVTGSSTLKVLLPCNRRASEAPDLNLVVPNGGAAPVGLFLQRAGYKWKATFVAQYLIDTVKNCFYFRHSSSGRLIILTESTRNTVLNVVLEGKSSLSISAITPKNIYSYYPAFTARGYAFSGLIGATSPEIQAARKLWGLDLRDPCLYPLKDDEECGVECPRLLRKTRKGHGIGVVCWNKEGLELGDLGNQRLSWQLGVACVNPKCKDKEPKLYSG